MTVSTASAFRPQATSSLSRLSYWQLWRRVPATLGYLLPNLVITIPVTVFLWLLFGLGIGFSVLYGGIFILIVMFYQARAVGTFELTRLRTAGMPEIARPSWPVATGASPHKRLWTMMSNAHYWLYFVHGAVVHIVLTCLTWAAALTWTILPIGGLTYWFWSSLLPRDSSDLGDLLYEYVPSLGITDPRTFNVVLYLVLGVVFTVTAPWVLRGMILLHQMAAKALLGRTSHDDLVDEVAALAASRTAAATAESAGLRRLERDIHDGPQQRLIRLQMDLAAAERSLDIDPARARTMLEEARVQATDTLEELRALSRGVAPPLLQDRGLVVSLESLVARNTIPTHFERNELSQLSPETELGAYFVVAELLSNTAKHSNASTVTVKLTAGDDADGKRLTIIVSDDGSGGAAPTAGHGLAGLAERVSGMRGEMLINSPVGGPTAVTVTLPLEL